VDKTNVVVVVAAVHKVNIVAVVVEVVDAVHFVFGIGNHTRRECLEKI